MPSQLASYITLSDFRLSRTEQEVKEILEGPYLFEDFKLESLCLCFASVSASRSPIADWIPVNQKLAYNSLSFDPTTKHGVGGAIQTHFQTRSECRQNMLRVLSRPFAGTFPSVKLGRAEVVSSCLFGRSLLGQIKNDCSNWSNVKVEWDENV